jgi:hypothetical protein
MLVVQARGESLGSLSNEECILRTLAVNKCLIVMGNRSLRF